MPYCPECREEFQEWVKVCPGCNVALVDELADLPEQKTSDELPDLSERKISDEPIVHIATAPNEIIANMWSGILEDNGIRCMLKGMGLQASMYASPLTVPYEIYVLESEADKAKEILEPFLEE